MRTSFETLVGLGERLGRVLAGFTYRCRGLSQTWPPSSGQAALALRFGRGCGRGEESEDGICGRLPEAYAVLQSSEAFKIHEAWARSLPFEVRRGRGRQGIDRGRHWTQAERSEAALSGWRSCARTWEDFFDKWDFLVMAQLPFPRPRKIRLQPGKPDASAGADGSGEPR